MKTMTLVVAIFAAALAAQDDKPSPVPSRSRRPSKLIASSLSNPEYKIGTVETGEAVYFSRAASGRKSASGEELDSDSLTGAHALYPFGSIIRVTKAS